VALLYVFILRGGVVGHKQGFLFNRSCDLKGLYCGLGGVRSLVREIRGMSEVMFSVRRTRMWGGEKEKGPGVIKDVFGY
jgi:hypothetical protein